MPNNTQNHVTDKSIDNLSTNSQQVLLASTGRRYVLFHNPSLTGTIYLALKPNVAVAGKGIMLLPGGSYVCEDQTIVANGFNAIASASALTLTIWEMAS